MENKVNKKPPFNIKYALNLYSNYFFCYIRSLVFRNSFIHVIGDSHTAIFRNEKEFVVHTFGPSTMFSLNKKRSTTNSYIRMRKTLKFIHKKKDIVILIYGEIDARIHIYNQYMKHKKQFPISYFIDKAIKNYGEILEELKNKNINFFVYGIPPASHQKNIYKIEYYASSEKRSEISRLFNEKLKIYCNKKNYNFIDIYPITTNERGFLKKEFATDETHLNKRILPFVKKIISNKYRVFK